MIDTIRERIIQAFLLRAKPLSPRLPIQRALRSVNESNDRFVSVWDGDDQNMDVSYGQYNLQFVIAIELVWKPININASISANALLGEVIKTMLTGSQSFNGLATSLQYKSALIGYPKDGSGYCSLTVGFTISYTTLKDDPYTQL
jgi:hypothetical protein